MRLLKYQVFDYNCVIHKVQISELSKIGHTFVRSKISYQQKQKLTLMHRKWPRNPKHAHVNQTNTSVQLKHLERFRDANSGYSCYKSAHAYKCTRVVQSRTFRVINKMATSYGYGWKQTVLENETRYSLKL